MPGIFGFAGLTAPSNPSKLLESMGHSLRHHPWYRENRYVDESSGTGLGRMALGLVDQAIEPAVSINGEVVVICDGEIHDYDQQKKQLADQGRICRGQSRAELLLHGYEQQGKDFFRGLHGKFIAAIWDGRKRRLILVNDRFGMRPLFYSLLTGRFIFAAEIKALLTDGEVRRGPHRRGIAQFFTFGHMLGEDTLLEKVRLLPAAGWVTYDLATNQVQVDRYWEFRPDPAVQGQTEQQILERIDRAFCDAVNRCVAGPGQLGLSLSGGLDARTILGVIGDQISLKTISIGIDGSMDHRSAAEMARLTHRQHHQCMLGEGFLEKFEDHLRGMVHLTDGHYLSQCIVMPTLPVYRDIGIQVLLRGHAGELMHMRKAYSFSLDQAALALRDEAGLEQWLYDHLQTYMMEGTEGKLFAPEYRQEMAELARDSLRNCLSESARLLPPVQRIWHLFLTQRLRRETAMSLVKFGSLTETRLPYVDNELVDALLSAPPEIKLEEKIQAHILRRHRPDFLRVMNVNTGTRMEAGPMARVFGKVRHKIFAKLGVRGYQPYERLGLWMRRELRPLVHRLLLSDRFLGRGLFDPDTVRDVVAHHMNGGNHTFLLLALMTYEMGQRAFIDREPMASGANQELANASAAG